MILGLLFACARPAVVVDPLASDRHVAAEAAARARVPDPLRGGPPPLAAASPLPPFLGVSRAGATYTGTAACVVCHVEAGEVWSASAHAGALGTLRDAQASTNPACLGCHVTGLGHPGGWAGAGTPGLAHVGCESCHGPGSAHAAAPASNVALGERYGELPADMSACVACHTHDTAPEFRFEAAWPRIAHALPRR